MNWSIRGTSPSPDNGYALVTVAASLFLLMGLAAYVVDLSAIRLDRAADQRITDAAASAGALATFEGSAVDGCKAALAYVEINTEGISGLDDTVCDGFSTSLTVSSGRWDITLVTPVPDSHELMEPGQIGASSTGVGPDDGDAADRFAVQMTATHSSNFAQVIGSNEGATTVHSVALAELPPPDGVPINLLLLERRDRCALQTSGNGGVIVSAVYNPEDDVIEPGVAAVDSDGSNVTCSGKGVINIEGTNSLLRADGPAGCPNQEGGAYAHPLAPHLLVGMGCGLIQTFADTEPPPDTCDNTVACTASGGASPNNPNPLPTKLPDRITRQPVDHRYNCWGDYTSPMAGVGWAADPLTGDQEIDGCSGKPPAVYNLIDRIGPTGSAPTTGAYQSWVPDAHEDCTVDSGDGPIGPLTGNWWINCDVFDVKDVVTFTDGDVVFEGDVNVTSEDGHLTIQNPGDPGIAFLRDGIFNKDSHAHLTLTNISVYASKSSRVTMSGGGGSLEWVAPNVEGYEFDDLALWSDSPDVHEWAGQAALTMKGVFFTPLALADYSGTTGFNQTDAQFIADKLHARGQGKLTLAPIFGNAVGIRPPPRTVLIR